MSEKKTAEIKLRIEPSRKARYQQAAADAEKGLSEWLIDCAEQATWTSQNQKLDGLSLVDNAISSLRDIGAGDSAAVARLEQLAADSNPSVATGEVPTKDRDSDWSGDWKPWGGKAA